jgi:MFS family permease
VRLPFFYGWVIVAVVFVTMGIGVNARTAFSLLFPPILGEFGWERGVVAGAFSFGFLVTAALSPVIGWLMDKRGPKLVMELGVVMMGTGLLLASYISQPWHLYATLGVLVGGGSVCLGYTGQSLFLPNWFVRKRGLAMSVAFAGVGIGSIILMPWMQTLIDKADWRASCWTLGLVVLLVLAPLNLLLWRRPEDIGLRPDGDAQTPGQGSTGSASNIVDPQWAAVDWTLGRALRTARFWWIAIGYICAMYAWYAVQVHQTKYLVEIGFTAGDAAWALGAVSLVAVPGQIALGHISDRMGREWVWSAACLGFVICYVALIALRQSPSFVLLYVMVVAQGALGYGYTSVMGGIVAEIFQGRHFGSIFGIIMLLMIGGGAVGPWLTGVIYDAQASYALGFWIAAGLAALSAVAIWLAAPRKVRLVAGQAERLARAKAGTG